MKYGWQNSSRNTVVQGIFQTALANGGDGLMSADASQRINSMSILRSTF